MDAAENLLKHEKVALDEDLTKPNVSGVKCDIVNECQMFIKAEDGGGDGWMDNTALDKDGNFIIFIT